MLESTRMTAQTLRFEKDAVQVSSGRHQAELPYPMLYRDRRRPPRIFVVSRDRGASFCPKTGVVGRRTAAFAAAFQTRDE